MQVDGEDRKLARESLNMNLELQSSWNLDSTEAITQVEAEALKTWTTFK